MRRFKRPEVYGDKLRAEQVEQIKANARREVLREVQAELSQMTPAARKVLMAGIAPA